MTPPPSGAILLASGKSFISRLIGRWTGSSWTHCGLILEVEGTTMLVEAADHGVQCISLDVYLSNCETRGTVCAYGIHDQVGPHNIDRIRSHALSLCGKPYDHGRLLELAVDIPFDLMNESDELPGHDGRYVCSRVVYECLLAGGVKLTTRGGYCTPASVSREIEIMERLV